MRKIRGQAALEFLTTYGWAFMVILVMIGALAYFGIMNPNNFLPERCTFSSELPCKDAQVMAGSKWATINIILSNNLGQSISGLKAAVKFIDNTEVKVCTVTPTNPEAGQNIEINCTYVPHGGSGEYPAPGTKVKFVINGTYTPAQGIYEKEFEGEIYMINK